MITFRPSNTLGVMRNNALESVRSFSNNAYYDARYLGINDLQALNDDTQQRFGKVAMHPHDNTEILSYQVAGQTRHIDTLGNNVVRGSGSVYLMSTGKGICHSEENLFDGPSRYLQIWLKPSEKNTTPTFSSEQFTIEQKTNTLCLLAGPDGPLTIKTPSKLFAGIFNADFTHVLDPTKTYYFYVVDGTVTANGQALEHRDAIKLESENELTLTAPNCEALFFEL